MLSWLREIPWHVPAVIHRLWKGLKSGVTAGLSSAESGDKISIFFFFFPFKTERTCDNGICEKQVCNHWSIQKKNVRNRYMSLGHKTRGASGCSHHSPLPTCDPPKPQQGEETLCWFFPHEPQAHGLTVLRSPTSTFVGAAREAEWKVRFVGCSFITYGFSKSWGWE